MPSEEIANSIAHGVAAVLSVVALALLVARGTRGGESAAAWGALIFGCTLVFAYTASTLYHAAPRRSAKHVLKVLDHAGIYLLIAGTYTPFCLLSLAGSGGTALLAAIWGAALVGGAVEALWAYRPRWISVLIYLGMGWAVLVKLPTLVTRLDTGALVLVASGGACYSIGTIFYLSSRVPYFHFVWHLFVIAGSTCHVLAVLLYLL